MKVYLRSSATSSDFNIASLVENTKEKKLKIDTFEWFNLYQSVSSDMTLRLKKIPDLVHTILLFHKVITQPMI